ncbi:MAG: hypothetical protein K6U11_08930 [bacterium]|nr:hypothetical protein [bacterium]
MSQVLVDVHKNMQEEDLILAKMFEQILSEKLDEILRIGYCQPKYDSPSFDFKDMESEGSPRVGLE